MPALSNAKWEVFCRAYMRGEHAGNARACYKAAYGKDNRQAASRLLQRDDILRRLAELREKAAEVEQRATEAAIEKLAITKDWVLRHLVENVERAMQARAVIGPHGEPVGEYEYDGAVANKALELLGKHVGMFIPPAPEPQSLNVNVGVELIDRPPRETFKQWEERRRRQVQGSANPSDKAARRGR